MKPKFIVDLNVGKLANRLRMLGYDALFLNGLDDNELVRIALKEGRVFRTQEQYVQCPVFNRIYWRGTHWQRMREELEELLK